MYHHGLRQALLEIVVDFVPFSMTKSDIPLLLDITLVENIWCQCNLIDMATQQCQIRVYHNAATATLQGGCT